MTKLAHVTFLIDRSGSMASIRTDVIGGFNQFLSDQQASPHPVRLTVHQFDTGGFDTLFEGLDVSDIRNADDADFQPRGGTPLLDSIARAITCAQIRADLHTDEQPIIVILTDGYENSSREYTNEAIRNLIAAKEAKGWVFTYLGANQDAFAQARAMGINQAATQNFVSDSPGVAAAFSTVSSATRSTSSRLAGGQSVASSSFYTETGTAANDDWATRTTTGTNAAPPLSPTVEQGPKTPKPWKK